MIEFRDVCYTVGGRTILDRLNVKVDPGETLVLLGRSGSGKTTALKLVNGLHRPTSGEVLVDGESTLTSDLIRLRRRIGYVIQDTGLFPHWSVARNVALVPGLDGRTVNVDALLQQVGLPAGEFAQRYPRELSGGQRQRVGIARALAAEPPVLLFDEPFGALDPITRRDMQTLFLDLRQQRQHTAIFVTHDVQEALRLGTRIALLKDGRLDTITRADEFVNAQTEEARTFLAALRP